MPCHGVYNVSEGIPNATLNMDDEIVEVLTETVSSRARGSLVSSASAPAGIVNLSRSPSNSSQSTNTSLTNTQCLIRSKEYEGNLDQYANNNNNPGSCGSLFKAKPEKHQILDDSFKPSRCIEITRNVLTIDDFGHRGRSLLHEPSPKNKKRITTTAKASLGRMCGECSPFGCFSSLFPILEWLPKYSIRANLLADIIAGITVSILHIPQGIAYSLLAGLGPVNGLYVSFFPVLIYALMGTSPHISVGTFAIASIMLNNIAAKMGAINEPSALFDNRTSTMSSLIESNHSGPAIVEDTLALPPSTIEVLTSVCLLCGLIQLSMGFLRLGSLSLILSEHLVSAFSTAIALHVATSQFTYIFGFETLPRVKSGPLKLIKSWLVMAAHVKSANVNSVIFSAIMIGILVLFKEVIEPRLKKRHSLPIPIDLLLVVFSILMSWLFKFNGNFSIQVVKTVPTGLPKPAVPRIDLMPDLLMDSFILSIVCFAVSLSLAKIYAKKHNYRVDPNQELVALGSANVFSSFFLSYPCSAALSRSTLQEKVGGKTQVAGLVSCGIILTVLLLLAPYLYHLPKCTLSCIILVALKSMFMQIKDLPTFWRISKLDGSAWLVTFCSVIILDIDLGLIVGISISILTLLIRLAVPKMNWLGQLSSTEIYAETEAYRNLVSPPGVQIVRFGSPLFYLNVETFKDKIMAAFPTDARTKTDLCSIEEQSTVNDEKRTLIIDLSGVSFIDKPGIDTLIEVLCTLQKRRISTCLAVCPFHVLASLDRVNFSERVQSSSHPCRIYPTVHDAVIDSQ